MKKIISTLTIIGIIITILLFGASLALAEEADKEISYDKVASGSEMTTIEEVGVEGMYPIYGTDIEDGEYEVIVESSSSMFKVEKAVLTVKDGKMQAVMTMGGKGYLKIYMGTGQEAAKADISDYIDYVVDNEGKHTFTVPVEALDQAMPCAAFSKNKEQWYDRSILFEAKSLPEGAVKVELPDYDALEKAARDKRIEALKAENEKESTSQPAEVDLDDGEYTVEVQLQGGTGRASITSPAKLIVREGKAYAIIEWSSSNYDYMKIGDEEFLPIQTEGNSTFEIPITVFDEPMSVIADTVAMSVPHEIEYTLTFDSDSIPSGGVVTIMLILAAVAIILIICGSAILIKRKNVKK